MQRKYNVDSITSGVEVKIRPIVLAVVAVLVDSITSCERFNVLHRPMNSLDSDEGGSEMDMHRTTQF